MTRRKAQQPAGTEAQQEQQLIANGSLAHAGSLIHRSPITGEIWLTKGGAHICYAPDLATAKRYAEEIAVATSGDLG